MVAIFIVYVLFTIYVYEPYLRPMYKKDSTCNKEPMYNEEYIESPGSQYTTPYSGSHGYGQWFGNPKKRLIRKNPATIIKKTSE